MTQPLTWDPKPFAQKWIKWSAGKKETFPGLPDTGAPDTMVPKPIGEAQVQATIRLTEHKNVSMDRIVKVVMFKQV